MGFETPAALLLIGAVWLVYRSWRGSRSGIAGWRLTASFIARTVSLVCVVLALSGLFLSRGMRRLAVVFCVDISDSIDDAARQKAWTFLQRACERLDENHLAGVVVFGRSAHVESAVTAAAPPRRPSTRSRTDATNISAALALAASIMPPDANCRIVLLSDGNENRGCAVRQTASLARTHIPVDTVILDPTSTPDVRVLSVAAPSTVRHRRPFRLSAVLESNIKTPAKVVLLRGAKPLAARELLLTPGRHRVDFNLTAKEAGFHVYKVVLEAKEDTRLENNAEYGFVDVSGKARMAYVSPSPTTLSVTLARCGFEVDHLPPSRLPSDPRKLASFNALVFENVSIFDLTEKQMEGLRRYVHEMGGGLLMVGGESSFGCGGWAGTPVEEALPVDCRLRKRVGLPDVAMVIVVDKSGSMGERVGGKTKLALAQEAAVAALKLLGPDDAVGVLFVDTEPQWSVRPERIGRQKKALAEQIRKARAGGGGIYVLSGLNAAYKALKDLKGRRVRHILLLADGSDCEQKRGCAELVKRAVAEGITLTTVALGTGGDVPFLARLASVGKGRAFVVGDARILPRLFMKEVTVVSGRAVRKGRFGVRVVAPSRMLASIEQLPPINGYCLTHPKPAADVLLASSKGEVVLARWWFGAGRAVAFTPSAGPPWAEEWLKWDRWRAFWGQIAGWLCGTGQPKGVRARADLKEGKLQIVVDLLDERGRYRNNVPVSATVLYPNGKAVTLPMRQNGPGRYQVALPAEVPGPYTITITERKNGTCVGLCRLGFAVPASLEQSRTTPNRKLLEEIARTTGGRVNPEPGEVFVPPPNPRRLRIPLRRWLLLFAVLLLLFEVALRRLEFRTKKAPVRAEEALGVGGAPPQKEPDTFALAATPTKKEEKREPEYLDRLLAAKKRAERRLKKKPQDSNE